NGGWAGTPRWSPNGREVVFDLARGTDRDIYVVDVEGGAPRRITTEPSDEGLASYSRDGKWIYFGSNRTGDSEIWKAPAAGGQAVQVTRHGGFSPFESPDGRYVYYTKNVDANTPLAQGIWRTPVDGSEEELVLPSFDALYFGDWAVVGNGIYF